MAKQDRFMGLDVHKQHIMVAAVDANQQVILKPRKIAMSRFKEWAENHFLKSDEVALEATTNAWDLVDQLEDLVGYARLGASVHASGQTYRTGKITKQGRKELRTILVECAWITIRMSNYWKEQYQRLNQRMPANKAITVIARKLLVVIWHVLSKREVDQHADPQYIARSLLVWSQQHGLAARNGILQRDFV